MITFTSTSFGVTPLSSASASVLSSFIRNEWGAVPTKAEDDPEGGSKRWTKDPVEEAAGTNEGVRKEDDDVGGSRKEDDGACLASMLPRPTAVSSIRREAPPRFNAIVASKVEDTEGGASTTWYVTRSRKQFPSASFSASPTSSSSSSSSSAFEERW